MNYLVMVTVDEEGAKVSNPKWCLVNHFENTPVQDCTGKSVARKMNDDMDRYLFKYIQRGGITCQVCNDRVMFYKKVSMRMMTSLPRPPMR